MDGCKCQVNSNSYVDVDCWVYPIYEIVVTAIKVELCNECGEDINPGDEYFREKFYFDEEFRIHKTCMDCKSVRDNVMCVPMYGGGLVGRKRPYIRW